MRFILTIFAAALVSGCNELRRDTPDETKVQVYPKWQAAPSNTLPVPE